MSNDSQKTPFVRSMNDFAEAKVAEAISLLGKSLPAKVLTVSGQIVTVSFEVQTSYTLPSDFEVPVATSFWRREPIQVGDLGVVRPSDVPLGGITGLGAGTASFPTATASLEALVWEPTANAGWDPAPDPNQYLVQGPNGFLLRDPTGAGFVNYDKAAGTMTLSLGGSEIVLSPSGVAITGTLTINGKPYLAHEHSGVQTGGGISGPVAP